MNKLLNSDTLFKLGSGLIAACSLYYALDKRLLLMEQKIDYFIASTEVDKKRNELLFTDLKNDNSQSNKDITELRERLYRIYAVLPKRVQIEDEQ